MSGKINSVSERANKTRLNTMINKMDNEQISIRSFGEHKLKKP